MLGAAASLAVAFGAVFQDGSGDRRVDGGASPAAASVNERIKGDQLRHLAHNFAESESWASIGESDAPDLPAHAGGSPVCRGRVVPWRTSLRWHSS